MPNISDKQKLAIRKHAANVMSTLGVKDLSEYRIHAMTWNDLCQHENFLSKTHRSVLNTIVDGMSREEVQEREDACDAIHEIRADICLEKDLRSGIGERGPRPHEGDPRRPTGEDRVIAPGGLDGGAESDAVYALRSNQSFREHVSRQVQNPYAGLTAGAYLRAMVLGGKTDLERRALSEGSDSAGGFTVPDVLSATLIDALRAASVVMRAGAMTVPLTSDVNYMAKVLTDPVPAWRSEAGPVGTGDPTFGRVTFTPRSLAVLVITSRELLEDSLNIETALPQVIANAMAVEVDRVALFGSGTPPEPKGVVNFTGVQSVDVGGALADYSKFVSARTKIKSANAPDATAFILHPEDEGTLANLQDTTNQPMQIPPAIASIPFLATTSVPSGFDDSPTPADTMAVTGYFPHLMIGMRSQLRIETLRERYADTLQYGFLAHLRMDVAAMYDSSFCKITGITHG